MQSTKIIMLMLAALTWYGCRGAIQEAETMYTEFKAANADQKSAKVAEFKSANYPIAQLIALVVKKGELDTLKALEQAGLKLADYQDDAVMFLTAAITTNRPIIIDYLKQAMALQINSFALKHRFNLAKSIVDKNNKILFDKVFKDVKLSDLNDQQSFELIKGSMLAKNPELLKTLHESGLKFTVPAGIRLESGTVVEGRLKWLWALFARPASDVTLLHVAIYAGSPAVVAYLLELPEVLYRQASITAKVWAAYENETSRLWTPLDFAYFYKNRNEMIAEVGHRKSPNWPQVPQRATPAEWNKIIKLLDDKLEKEYEKLRALMPSGSKITDQFAYKDSHFSSPNATILHAAVLQPANGFAVFGVLGQLNTSSIKKLLATKADIKFGDVPFGPVTPKELAERLKGLVAPTKLTWGMAAYGAALRKKGLTEELYKSIITALETVKK